MAVGCRICRISFFFFGRFHEHAWHYGYPVGHRTKTYSLGDELLAFNLNRISCGFDGQFLRPRKVGRLAHLPVWKSVRFSWECEWNALGIDYQDSKIEKNQVPWIGSWTFRLAGSFDDPNSFSYFQCGSMAYHCCAHHAKMRTLGDHCHW